MTDKPALHALLLDMDGVLVDSEAVHQAAWTAMFAEHGVRFGADRYAREAAGRSRDDVIHSVLGPAVDLQAAMDRKAELVVELLTPAACPALPGAAELIAEAQQRGLKIAVATSSRMPGPYLQAAGLAADLEAVLHRGLVPRGKPSPDVYQAAAAALHEPVEHCLAVEDSPIGVLAARAAGLLVVALTTTHAPQDLAKAGATWVVDHHHDVWRVAGERFTLPRP